MSEYESAMAEQGFRREIVQYGTLEQVAVLGEVSDPDLLQMLTRIGSTPLRRTAGITR